MLVKDELDRLVPSLRPALLCLTQLLVALLLSGCVENKVQFNLNYACQELSLAGRCTHWYFSGTVIGKGSENSGGSCFPGDAVLLGRAGPVRMSDLRIGDEVLGLDSQTGKHTYTSVRTWLHHDLHKEVDMLSLRTHEGPSLVASPGHMVALRGKDEEILYRAASEVQVGDALVASNGSSVVVEQISTVAGKGLYAPLTYTSNLFVAGSALGDPSSSGASTAPTATERPYPGAVLAHSFAHVHNPQRYENAWHLLMSIAEMLMPSMTSIDEEKLFSADRPSSRRGFVHPLAKACWDMLGVALTDIFSVTEIEFGPVPYVPGRRLAGGGGGGAGQEITKRMIRLIVQLQVPSFVLSP